MQAASWIMGFVVFIGGVAFHQLFGPLAGALFIGFLVVYDRWARHRCDEQ